MSEQVNNGQLERIRHSASHVMAQAVLEMFPEGKLAFGPPIENGCYYDFDLPRPLTPEDLAVIWDEIEKHDELEKETIRLGKKVAEDCPFFVQKTLIDYLIYDERHAVWTLTLELDPGRYRYQFLVEDDHETWEAIDPSNPRAQRDRARRDDPDGGRRRALGDRGAGPDAGRHRQGRRRPPSQDRRRRPDRRGRCRSPSPSARPRASGRPRRPSIPRRPLSTLRTPSSRGRPRFPP